VLKRLVAGKTGGRKGRDLGVLRVLGVLKRLVAGKGRALGVLRVLGVQERLVAEKAELSEYSEYSELSAVFRALCFFLENDPYHIIQIGAFILGNHEVEKAVTPHPLNGFLIA